MENAENIVCADGSFGWDDLGSWPALARHIKSDDNGNCSIGDIVEVEVEGLGRLSNKIVHGATPIRDDVGAQPSSSEEVVSTAMGGDWEFRGQRAAGGQGSKFYKSSLKKK